MVGITLASQKSVGVWLIGAVLGVVAGAPSTVDVDLIRARDDVARRPSPRRLFNLGLADEEASRPTDAVARYLAARGVPRSSFADALYARGAGLRLLRLLAGRDDDAAAAVAFALARDGDAKPGEELSPLVRSLLARVDRDLLAIEGLVVGMRITKNGEAEVEVADAEGRRHRVLAPAPVRPFTAGDEVRVVARAHPDAPTAPARLVAMGAKAAAAWALLAVRGD